MTLAGLFAGGRRPRCYVASPLGFGEATRGWYADRYLPALAEFVEPVDPWSLTGPDELDRAARRNTEAIDSCELLIAHLDGQEIDSGTAAELGYAVGRGLPVLAVRSDFRRAGEEGMVVNLQVQGFVEQSGGSIYRGLDQLLGALAALRGAA